MASRSYKSDLRNAQAEATRERILDAVVEVLAGGVEALSVPAVARRAGVSVGTVYRHFGDKSGLLQALVRHAGKRTGTVIEELPTSIEELEDVIRRVFRHFDQVDDVLRAAFASRIGRESRIGWTRERLDAMRSSLAAIDPTLEPDELEHLAKASLLLTTSDVYRELRERLGLTSDAAADEVIWMIRTLLRGVER